MQYVKFLIFAVVVNLIFFGSIYITGNEPIGATPSILFGAVVGICGWSLFLGGEEGRGNGL